ncbi:hypothetical protein GGR51DRAFT_578609 [Nemania sp. FL0031]|nr:hypothetical protein GGR51DRAFT_578609 [Nemania sp. FL0031]
MSANTDNIVKDRMKPKRSIQTKQPIEPKSWILTPSYDNHPDRDLEVGQILTDPGDLETALVPPGSIPPDPRLSGYNIRNHVTIDSTHYGETDIDVWARLNAAITVGSDNVKNSGLSSNKFTLVIDHLETKTIQPKIEDINKALSAEGVSSKTEWWKSRRRIFVVTGVRIARGAVIRVQDQSEKIEETLTRDNQQTSLAGSIGSKLDFVFAYRLHEINYRIRRSVGVYQSEARDSYHRNWESDEKAKDKPPTDVEPSSYKLEDIN